MRNKTSRNEQSFDTLPDVLTVDQLCMLLHVGKHTIYELLHSGQLRSRRVGRAYRIRKADVEGFFDGEG